MTARNPEPLGYVLTDTSTRGFKFIVADGMENHVEEGVYITVHDGTRRILATVTNLSYYHEFYDEKDIWAEAVRKGHKPPQGVGRQFLLARAMIVGETGTGEVNPPDRPPRPGSPVYPVSGSDLSVIFGHDPMNPQIPEHLLPLGDLYGYTGLRALLDLRAVTMHIGIIGTTGSGKTNTVSVIIEELGSKTGVDAGVTRLPRTIPAFVVDLNADYTYLYENPDLIKTYSKIIRLVGANSPVLHEEPLGRKRIRPLTLDLNALEPYELAEAVASLYKGGMSEGSMLAVDLLTRVFSEIACAEPDCIYDRNGVFTDNREYENLLEEINSKYENLYHKATISAAKRILGSLWNASNKYGIVSRNPIINEDFIDSVTDPERPSLVLLDMSSDGLPAPLNVKQFIVYYMAQLLFDRFVEYRSRAQGGQGSQRVALFVIEEAQNFAPNLQTYKLGYSVARSLLATIATQGRKFGLGLVLVTQRPSYVDQVVMSMMNSFIIHRVAPFDIKFVENITGGFTHGFTQNLATMRRGTAIIVGQINPSPLPLVANIRKRSRS